MFGWELKKNSCTCTYQKGLSYSCILNFKLVNAVSILIFPVRSKVQLYYYNRIYGVDKNSVETDQLASDDASWSVSTLFSYNGIKFWESYAAHCMLIRFMWFIWGYNNSICGKYVENLTFLISPILVLIPE